MKNHNKIYKKSSKCYSNGIHSEDVTVCVCVYVFSLSNVFYDNY